MPVLEEKKKQNRRLTRRMAKYISLIVSAGIIVLSLFSTAHQAIKIVKNGSAATARNVSETLVHEYALISQYLFEGAQSDLKQFAYDDKLIRAKTPEQIVEALNIHFDSKAPYYTSVGFAFADGKCITASGAIVDVSKDRFFTEIINGKKESSIMGPFFIPESGVHTLVIARAVYNPDGSVKGVVSGTVNLTTLRQLTDKMDIKNDGRFFLLGDEGKFICHVLDSLLGNAFEPDNPQYKEVTSKYLAEKKNGVFDTVSYDGRAITIYLEEIPGTDWSCGVIIDKAQILAPSNKIQTIIIHKMLMTLAIILVIFIFSSVILNNSALWDTYYDPLTELWTRPKFEKEAQALLDKNEGSSFVAMEIDIPGFKFINQSFGKTSADEILKIAAEEILDFAKYRAGLCCRGYADHFYFISPIGNVGEFMETFETMITKAESALAVTQTPVHLKYGITFVLPQIQFYNTKRTVQDLVGEASYAKGTIKNNMLQTYAIYSRQMQEKIDRDQRIERHMEHALERGEFFVVYQPKIGLEDDKIKGAEALVRWNSTNEKLGFLSPADFIPVFEKNGFIVKLDFEVYEMVFKFLRQQLDAGNPVVPISVNMSRSHKNPDKFVKEFVSRFKKYNLDPSLIEIEILERSADEDAYNLVAVTEKLHECGFSVAMDDFGSGQSSLNMLSEVPIDVLKFDQSFLKKDTTKEGHIQMINTLLGLGKILNKKTLFEGVETEEQRDMLRSFNCDQVQGYFYSRPLAEKDFVSFIKDHI